MSILHIHRLFGSSHAGWDEFSRTQPASLKLFAFLVLPFSLVPPLMLEYAGQHVGAALFPHTTGQAWSMTALFFLFAELISVPLIAWGIKSVANSKGIASDYHDAFALAAIAPIPLWVSSLALLSDQVLLIVALVGLGVIGSIVLIFRGVASILRVEESLVAFDIAYVVAALGLAAWMLLAVLGLFPAIT